MHTFKIRLRLAFVIRLEVVFQGVSSAIPFIAVNLSNLEIVMLLVSWFSMEVGGGNCPPQ